MFDETIKSIEAEIEWIDYELRRQSTTQNQELRLKEKKNALFGIIEQMSIYQQRYGKSKTKKEHFDSNQMKIQIEVLNEETILKRAITVNGVEIFSETVSNDGVHGFMMFPSEKKKNAH